MKLIKSFLCCGLLLLFVVSAKAQDDRIRLGFGVGIGMNSLLGSPAYGDFSALSMPASFANFTFVIRGNNFRFEPNFGYFSFSETRDVTNPYESYKRELTSSNFRLGAVIAYATAIGSMKLYYGIFIGAIFSSASSYRSGSTSQDKSKTDFAIGPAIGGEYMFSDHFSLGGEIQCNYISVGQWDENDNEPGYSSDISQTIVSTNGLVVLRWYVN
jgi:hypothetical protein